MKSDMRVLMLVGIVAVIAVVASLAAINVTSHGPAGTQDRKSVV